METVADLERILRHLGETIAWSRLHVNPEDPRNCLRTPELRPANARAAPNYSDELDYNWGTPEENQAILAVLAEERALRLRAANAYSDIVPSDLAGGRLLVAAVEESDTCGLSAEESQGFFDLCDVPAWDTWIWYIKEPTEPDPALVPITQEKYRDSYYRVGSPYFVDWQPPASVAYILCWIPPEFLTLAEDGIGINPVECIFWATEYNEKYHNTPLLRKLDAMGLLR